MNRRRVTRLAALYCLLVVAALLIALAAAACGGPIDSAVATQNAYWATVTAGADLFIQQLTAVPAP
jgi:hypothetical protein